MGYSDCIILGLRDSDLANVGIEEEYEKDEGIFDGIIASVSCKFLLVTVYFCIS